MSKSPAIPTSTFVWFEYVSTDAPKAQGFFGELFGWTKRTVPMPGLDYTMIAAGEQTIGGYLAPPPGVPPQAHWLTHLQVANAQDTAAQVKKLGGKVMKEPFKMGDHGTMAVVIDPQGAALALWQPAKVEATKEPENGHFVWNELFSSDPTSSVAFYTAIAGLTDKAMEMPGMGTYHVLEGDGQPRAGITQMPGAPHAWLPYVKVANADASAEKAKRLGATLIVPPTDIPNVGRFSIFKDPQGATLGILQPAR